MSKNRDGRSQFNAELYDKLDNYFSGTVKMDAEKLLMACREAIKPNFPDTVENLRGEVTTWKDAFKKYASHKSSCDTWKGSNKKCTCGLFTYLDLIGKD